MAAGTPNTEFKLVAKTQQEEDAFDFVSARRDVRDLKPTGVIGAVAHMVKGALGAGILSGHVAYMRAGLMVGAPMTFVFGAYITYCLYVLVRSTQVMYKRTRVPFMTYSDVGEASMVCFPNPKIARFSKAFRYYIDVVIVMDLYGSCATYQIIIAKTFKQLAENVQETTIEGKEGLPNLRIYLICMIIPIVLICLIRHLKWLAPFSIAANFIVAFAIMMAIYYCFVYNPNFEDLVTHTDFYGLCQYAGMSVFAMSCSGVVIPIENNMAQPHKFPFALTLGMGIIVVFIFCSSFFGYVGFREKSESPITMNFPMTIVPKALKGLIAIMLYVTHALNFWVPFNICFYYIKKRHDQTKIVKWEYVYRALFVVLISCVGIAFPSVDDLIGFIGAFCLSNMAFIWPNVITLLVIWERPGLGKFYWRLWVHCVLLLIGTFLLVCGSIVNAHSLMSVFM